MRRPLNAVLVAAVLLSACGLIPGRPGTETFDDLVACIPPADPGSPQEGSLPVLVDRADVIALVTVTKAEHSYAYSAYKDRVGARLLTLRTQDVLKGQAAAELTVDDGPCPSIVGTEGESFVVLLTTKDGVSRTPVSGMRPTGALRATPSRTLPQLVAAIRAIRPIDGDARALYSRFGWTVTATESASEFDLPPIEQFAIAGREIAGAQPAIMGSLDRYALVSDDIGLDLRASAGKRVELLTFWLEQKPPDYNLGTPFGDVLIFDRRIVAAWVRISPWAGPFSLRDRAGTLKADPNAQPSFPPANRFPGAINIAKVYDLTKAKALFFKSGAGANGDIVDVARVRAFADALDVSLPTRQAVWDRNGTPTTYYLHFAFEGSLVSLEYDATSGMLISVADGFAVEPGAAFASLVASLK